MAIVFQLLGDYGFISNQQASPVLFLSLLGRKMSSNWYTGGNYCGRLRI